MRAGMPMSTDIPQPVRLVLDEYLGLVHEAVPGLLDGVYLQGSLALGTFNPRLSDIDFIAVTSRRRTPADIAGLRALHQAPAQRHPDAKLEGGYLQWRDLGRLEEAMPPHPHIHDNIFHPSREVLKEEFEGKRLKNPFSHTFSDSFRKATQRYRRSITMRRWSPSRSTGSSKPPTPSSAT